MLRVRGGELQCGSIWAPARAADGFLDSECLRNVGCADKGRLHGGVDGSRAPAGARTDYATLLQSNDL